jgi:hypothetical protein
MNSKNHESNVKLPPLHAELPHRGKKTELQALDKKMRCQIHDADGWGVWWVHSTSGHSGEDKI